MPLLEDIHIGALSLDRFTPVLGEDHVLGTRAVAKTVRERLGGRAIWNVSSTAVGGGVAEMLPSLLAYARGESIDARWVVIRGDVPFFRLTKRIHHALHGTCPHGGLPGPEDRALYEEVTSANAAELAARLGPGDVVILHDPQTAGMAPLLVAQGAHVIWRSHIGQDRLTPEVAEGWAFLMPYLANVPALVFTRRAYAPAALQARAFVVRPSIDAFSPKNQELSPETVRGILGHIGVIAEGAIDPRATTFVCLDGSPARVERFVDIVRAGPAPRADVPLIVQISRWDPLKDMAGVMHGFARLIESGRGGAAQLVLAGPNVHGVPDDPEGPELYRAMLEGWYALPASARARIQLVMVPTADVDENAAIINALQRHAMIIVQKSLHEGFGLTVTEAMWKGRPVVASRVGGIQDQIVQGESGLMIDDPRDLASFADALALLIGDPERSRRMGVAAKERAREHFLGIRHLLDYADMITRLIA
jgi:trehalose synthase